MTVSIRVLCGCLVVGYGCSTNGEALPTPISSSIADEATRLRMEAGMNRRSLTIPRVFQFNLAFPDERRATSAGDAATLLGFSVQVGQGPDRDYFDCVLLKRLTPSTRELETAIGDASRISRRFEGSFRSASLH
jgi:hypothetical protein